jgi:nicotinamide mononucleotide transporter
MPNKKENKMKNPFKDWTMFEKSWLAIFTLIAIGLSYTWGDTLFSFSVFLTGVICVVLVARGSIWNYSYGLYNAGGYAWLSYQNGLFGEVMLNAGYFLPAQIVGIFLWKKNLAEGATVVMKKMRADIMVWTLLSSGILTLAYGMILMSIPGQNTPFFDSCSTVLSVIAMLLMMLRYREQWILWIIVDIVSVAMWAFRLESGVEGAPAMLVMWSAYLINAFYGWYKWNKLAVSEVENV